MMVRLMYRKKRSKQNVSILVRCENFGQAAPKRRRKENKWKGGYNSLAYKESSPAGVLVTNFGAEWWASPKSSSQSQIIENKPIQRLARGPGMERQSSKATICDAFTVTSNLDCQFVPSSAYFPKINQPIGNRSNLETEYAEFGGGGGSLHFQTFYIKKDWIRGQVQNHFIINTD
ncbi:hypothetical protein BC829DRAFT_416623 [Chytridium lagenaria]|nr:hypothetical protein BC829DRAFT_416623 [Chytridium lagenaria]